MKRNPLELAILTVSLATVIALIAYLSNDALLGTGSAASFRVDVGTGAAANGGDGWLVPLRVRNSGGQAALDVTLVGRASVDGVDETSQLTVGVLAAESSAELVLGFSAHPDGEVTIRIVGFEAP